MGERPRNKFGTPEHPIGPKPGAIVLPIRCFLPYTKLTSRRPKDIVHRITIGRNAPMQLVRPRILGGQTGSIGRNDWKVQRFTTRRIGGAQTTRHEHHRSAHSTGMLTEDERRRRVRSGSTGTQATSRTLHGKRVTFKTVGQFQEMQRQRGHTAKHDAIVSGVSTPKPTAAVPRVLQRPSPIKIGSARHFSAMSSF